MRPPLSACIALAYGAGLATGLSRFPAPVIVLILLVPLLVVGGGRARALCAGAIVLSKVGTVVFGAWDNRAGMAGSVHDLLRHPRLNHRPEVIPGVMEEACGEVLKQFFRARR